MTDIKEKVLKIAKNVKEASYKLANIDSTTKDNILRDIIKKIKSNTDYILKENQKDIDYATSLGLSTAVLDRLKLTPKRIEAMIASIEELIKLKDPIGEIINLQKRPNGLLIGKMRVPLGVICVIYEARPNVTTDAASICLKSSNALILRGGVEAINSNQALAKLIQDALVEHSLPKECVEFISIPEREVVTHLAKLPQYIDMMILRGGKGLLEAIGKEATVNIMYHGEGNCHVYVAEDADLKMAEEIVFNAKVQRPGVCNAAETLLVDEKIAEKFLPKMISRLTKANVEIRGCQRTKQIVKDIKSATEEDWYKEYLDLILAVKVVKDIEEAISHINKYGSSHSDAIVTSSYSKAWKFVKEVDSSSVYVNASTRFTDGYEFGLGGEIGISTQKLHARGPMSVNELTTTKFIIFGNGHTRS
jgi:glutamate-5-semialdehyde dehydrogenase